jgi:3-oxoacyl-[acyl-carrier protein] reductase
MDLGIAGRTAAVAGGSAGLGKGTARALIADGVTVAICGRDQARLDATAHGLGAIPIVADVSTPDGARGFVTAAIAALGHVDILVPNAGGPPPGNVEQTDFSLYEPALRQNLLSVVAMCEVATPGMFERGWGRIVAITSSSVRSPVPYLVLSNVARAGTTAFLKTLAGEAGPHGVTVNSVQPGMHATDRLKHLGADLDQLAAGLPVRAVGHEDDFGSVVAFLCSEQAKFITGTSVLVDGGAYGGF